MREDFVTLFAALCMWSLVRTVAVYTVTVINTYYAMIRAKRVVAQEMRSMRDRAARVEELMTCGSQARHHLWTDLSEARQKETGATRECSVCLELDGYCEFDPQ